MAGKRKTEKQKKLIKLISENLGNKKPKSMYQILLEAGFSETTARQQTRILAGIEDDLKDIVYKLEKERDAILNAMARKRGKAKYADLARSLDIVIKNSQLLSGKATGREEQILNEDQINAIIARRTKSGNSSGQI